MTLSPEQEPQPCDKIIELLELLQRRARRQSIAIVSLILAVFFLAAAILGHLLNYFGGDETIYRGSIALASLISLTIGWLFGWSAGRLVARRKGL